MVKYDFYEVVGTCKKENNFYNTDLYYNEEDIPLLTE